jgi:hypothetical protein
MFSTHSFLYSAAATAAATTGMHYCTFHVNWQTFWEQQSVKKMNNNVETWKCELLWSRNHFIMYFSHYYIAVLSASSYIYICNASDSLPTLYAYGIIFGISLLILCADISVYSSFAWTSSRTRRKLTCYLVVIGKIYCSQASLRILNYQTNTKLLLKTSCNENL